MADNRHHANVCYIVDLSYFEFFLVSLCSLVTSKHESTCLHIYVLLNNIPISFDAAIAAFKSASVDISIIQYNEDEYQMFVLNYISNTTYTRLKLPDILKNVDKVLYLDSDTIILDDILDLYNTDISVKPIAGVKEWTLTNLNTKWGYIQYLRDEFEHFEEKYFNAGVLLMNLEYMRNDLMSAKCLIVFDEHKEFKYNDQDILNWLYDEDTVNVHPRWNCQCSLYFTDNFDGYYKYNDNKELIQKFNECYGTGYLNFMHVFLDAKILHYVGDKKECFKNMLLRYIYDKQKQNLILKLKG